MKETDNTENQIIYFSPYISFQVPCPIALFYFNNAKNLMPIAIQLFQSQQQGQGNPVRIHNLRSLIST